MLLVFLLAALTPLAHAAEPTLRRCTNEACGRYAASDVWTFCPYCGTELPEPAAPVAVEQSVLRGNVYHSAAYGYSIERPSEEWEVLMGDQAHEMNDSADVVIRNPDGPHIMVMADVIPDQWPLKQFASVVEPEFTRKDVVFRKDVKIDGLEAMQVRFDAAIDEVPLIWDQTLIKSGERYFQINVWSVPWQFDAAMDQAVETLHDSFKLVPDDQAGAMEGEAQPVEAGDGGSAKRRPRE